MAETPILEQETPTRFESINFPFLSVIYCTEKPLSPGNHHAIHF